MLLNDSPASRESRSSSSPQTQVSGQGIASLVLGTFAVAVSFIPVLGLPALILGPLAIILAYFASTGHPPDTVTAKAGLILGITGTVVALIVTVITIYGAAQYTEKIRNFPFNASAQGPAAWATTGAVGTDRTAAASAPIPRAIRSAAPTGQLPGKDCPTGSGGTKGGQPVTFIVEGEPGRTFNIDYGTPVEYGCAEGATGRWEANMLMSDPIGTGITT